MGFMVGGYQSTQGHFLRHFCKHGFPQRRRRSKGVFRQDMLSAAFRFGSG